MLVQIFISSPSLLSISPCCTSLIIPVHLSLSLNLSPHPLLQSQFNPLQSIPHEDSTSPTHTHTGSNTVSKQRSTRHKSSHHRAQSSSQYTITCKEHCGCIRTCMHTQHVDSPALNLLKIIKCLMCHMETDNK